jgi:hypothetical protein
MISVLFQVAVNVRVTSYFSQRPLKKIGREEGEVNIKSKITWKNLIQKTSF